jgi:hypothetical protein
MAQADPDFDWTTAQPVEEDEASAALTATTFGQRSMPAPTQGPVNVDTEFDWKTASLDEPFDPATAQPISEQEEHQLYQDLEVASRDPQRILTNTEHSLLYDHRQQQDNAVARFFEGASDIPGSLVQIGADAAKETAQNYAENYVLNRGRLYKRNIATGMEVGRKVGVQLLQLFDWGQSKAADIVERGRANDVKMREIAATVQKTGDARIDGDNVMAAIAKAREEGVFDETPFGPNKEEDYERYLRQNSYNRSHAGNITEATMGGQTMSFPEEQMAFMGERPMQSVATGGAMIFDPINAIPLGVGAFSKLRVLRRLSRVTGMPLPAIERGLAGAADRMEDFGSGVAARVTDRTGLSKTQQVATLTAVSGGAGLLAANTDGMDGILLPLAAVSGIVPAYKLVGGTIRKTSQAAGTGAMVLREMRAGNIGTVRQAAADDLLRTGAVPPQFAAYMRPYASGVESTLGRVAKNPDNPEITRKLARLADNAGVTQAVRFADDAVSSGIAATLASTPFAMLAPDAEQAGAIVGGAATLGTFAGPITGAVGRRASRVDADIARMLIDVHAVNGDVPALISLGRDRLGQIAGMQGVVAGKTDFVTLRASDYRANVDVRESGAETAAGVFVEKASNGTARIFINVGEPASMEGKVRVRDRGDGVREIRIRGNDGRTEFIAAPKGRRLLVNDGDTVTAGQQVVDHMPPTRSMPHEIAHAILTSDILDGDIRTDMRNYITQVYGEDGIKSRGREYMAQIVDGDIMFGTHEGAVALTPEEIADVRSGKRTMSDVMKGKPVEAAERDALIEARIDEYNQRSREKGGNDYDWARDEVVAEQFAGEAKGIDFRGIRAGGPKVLESALATSARVLEALGAKFDRTTGKPLDNPSVLFRNNPLFQSPVLRKRMIEHVRAYNDLLNGLEQAGKREVRGTKVSVDGTPDSAARSPHTKMRSDPDKSGQVGNEFLYVDDTGKVQWRSPSEVKTREGSRTSQAKTMYNPSRILAPSSTEFGLRTTDSGRTIISGPTLPAQFDHFVHFPKWMREKARELEAGRDRGATYIADYNAIGDGKDGTYRVRNRGDIRAIQREVAFVGWEMTRNNHLKTILMDLNAFRGAAMKAINNGELGIFNNDMQVIEADLRAYLDNHKNGRPGETGIGQAKRDMLNGLIGTGTAVQRKANPLYSDLNPRGSVRSFRLDRYNDLTPTGREGLPFDYDKINNNRMPQQIPREAQGMPDAVDALTTDQLQRQYEENQGYLGLSTLGMREGRPVRGGAAQTRELLRRNEAISAELQRRGVREEDPQLQRALAKRQTGQAMPDVILEDDVKFAGREWAKKLARARAEHRTLLQEHQKRHGKKQPSISQSPLLFDAIKQTESVFKSRPDTALKIRAANNAINAINKGFAIELADQNTVPLQVMDAAVRAGRSKSTFRVPTQDTVVSIFDRSGFEQAADGIVLSGHYFARLNDRPLTGTVIKTKSGYEVAITGDELNKASQSSAAAAGLYNVVGKPKDYMRQVAGGEATRVDGQEPNQLFDSKAMYYLADLAENEIDLIDAPDFVQVTTAVRPEDMAKIQKDMRIKGIPMLDSSKRNRPEILQEAKDALRKDTEKGWPWVQRPDDEAAGYENPTVEDANGNRWVVVADGTRNASKEFTYVLELNGRPVASIVSPVFDPNKLLGSQIDALFSAVNPDWFYVAKQPKK